MNRPLTDLYVVTHTHWDREWYRTASRFRQRLVRLVDELLDSPPADGASFLLDGQAVLLQDYLSVRPERAAELAVLLREGKLEAGPWYVLADELIPGGEALVRNLIIGGDTVRRLRTEPPPVLYCPDSFGHPAILPDLAAGFGFDLIVLWRGFGGARSLAGDVVRWRGAGGAVVIAYHLPPDGYEFGSSLPTDDSSAAERWSRIARVLVPRSTTGAALLLNGADHHARQRELGNALDALARAAAPVRVHATSLRGAASAIVRAAATTPLDEVPGELRDSYGYTWTLQGTLGTRASQKRRNARAERHLVHDVEPWLALAPHGGDSAARALLTAAWRALLHAHPHDTLCGTSIDAVADAFDARLASVEHQVGGLREDALLDLVAYDREAARAAPQSWRPAVLLRNPVARPRGGVVELSLAVTLADVAVGPGSATRQGARRSRPRWPVEGMIVQVLARRERVMLTESPRAYPDADLVAQVDAVGWVAPMAGYSVETRPQTGRNESALPHPVVVEGNTLDNGLVRIEVSASGEVSLWDRTRDRRVSDALSLERRRDVGDSYTPALRDVLDVGRPRRVRVLHRGPLRGAIAIEYASGARDAGVGGACTLVVSLDADSQALRVLVRGENRSHDHRLRLRVATGIADPVTLADAAFLPVVRKALDVPPAEQSMEHVVPTAPLHRWVAHLGTIGCAAIASDGLAEYESASDGALVITLVRAIGQLSRHDLPERPGHAGWPAETPGAQSIGPYEASIALQLFDADGPPVRDAIAQFAEDMLLPITGETLRSNLNEPVCAGRIELVGDGLAFSAAAPARRAGWIVLRCVNRRETSVRGAWHLHGTVEDAMRSRLDETEGASLLTEGSMVAFVAAEHEIVTILVRLGGPT